MCSPLNRVKTPAKRIKTPKNRVQMYIKEFIELRKQKERQQRFQQRTSNYQRKQQKQSQSQKNFITKELREIYMRNQKNANYQPWNKYLENIQSNTRITQNGITEK